MPGYCCVPQCRSATGGHSFPKNPQLNYKWRVAVRRTDPSSKKLWKPKQHDKVCSLHFREDDYTATLLSERKRLKPKAVPSIFPFDIVRATPSSASRDSRVARRRQVQGSNLETEPAVPDFIEEVEIENQDSKAAEEQNTDSESFTIESIDVACQCSLLTPSETRESIKLYQHDFKSVQYLTGFNHYDHFMFFFACLGPAVHHLNFKCISPQDQCFLTLMKLRQGFDDIYLALRFKLSKSTVSEIINTWINFMFFQLSEINIWPDREVIDDFMPFNFKKQFPNTRVILDATETPINKPSRVDDQSVTFSTYKNKNTLKTIIGCSPRGLITYVSDSYGGSASDRQIIERSELCSSNMLSSGDSVMADRGIMVQDIFANKDVYINTPSMLKGKSQLDAVTVVRDRRIASKRIHIERVIGLGKTFKIVERDLPHQKIAMGGRIVKVCFLISNFKKSIVSQNA